MTLAALIVAAGKGARAGGARPKQWHMLCGKRVIDWTVAAFQHHPMIDHICVVLAPDESQQLNIPDVTVAVGGATRRASVQNGLRALYDQDITHVLIHDAARPCVSQDLISAVYTALANAPAAAPALPVADALWHADGNQFISPQPREGLYGAQTPQGFDYAQILSAHQAYDGDTADDVEIARAAGLAVKVIPGEARNLKITQADDFALAAQYLRTDMNIRIGSGYDVHRFATGSSVRLCDVDIPHDRSLSGHSDADVALHALCDAIYGGLAEGDIGRHFPPSDPQWKGAKSRIFLDHAVKLTADMGYRLGNIDLTLICEEPKITPHATAMRTRLAQLTGLKLSEISVKATTSEGLGFTGRKEGIAAQASVVLVPA